MAELLPKDIKVGTPIWTKRYESDGWGGHGWDCAGVISTVSKKDRIFTFISYDDMAESKPIPFDDDRKDPQESLRSTVSLSTIDRNKNYLQMKKLTLDKNLLDVKYKYETAIESLKLKMNLLQGELNKISAEK